MKQVFLKKGEIVIEEMPVPVCRENGILVKTSHSLISAGTERSALESPSSALSQANPENIRKVLEKMKKQGFSKTMQIVQNKLEAQLSQLGYSASGIVIEVGKNVKEFSVGDRVACAGAGYANHSEYVFVPKNLAVKIPDNVNFEEAAFSTVGSIALQGIRRSDARLGENIAVVGLGLIGLLACQMLKAAGCNVIGLDIDENRVNLARKFVDKGIVIKQKGTVVQVMNFTNGIGVDAAIITASSPTNDPMIKAQEICRKKGKVVVIGNIDLKLLREPFFYRELDIVASNSYGPGRYDPVYEEKGVDYPHAYVRWTENRNMQAFLNMLSKKQINIQPLISKVFKINQAENAYKALFDKSNVAVLFQYGEAEKSRVVEWLLQFCIIF